MLWRPKLRVTAQARSQIRHAVAAHSELTETGGALFGIETSRRKGLRVIAASRPGPNAIHQPARFERDLDYTHQIALEMFTQSGAQWVGEWHSHPTGDLTPSALDLSTYHTHLRDASLGFDQFISIIVDPTPQSNRATIWTITTNGTTKQDLTF